jgi:hypothetical protein
LPIYGQYFAHKPSLYRLSCTMQAFFESKIRGCHSLPPSVGKLPPYHRKAFPRGRGPYREMKGTTPLQRRNK